MQFDFKRHRRDKISREAALDALERAAEFFGYVEFGKRDLAAADVGLSGSAVRNAFDGSWTAALEALCERLHEKGKELKPRNREVWTEQEMYDEMHRIWTQIGHRPSKAEWNAANPQISYNTYRQRFHGWENACLKFIEHQMHDYVQEMPQPQPKGAESNLDSPRLTLRRTDLSERRDPSQTLINKVWKRDNFRCRRCGRSPATHFGVVLEVDHVVPWAKDGKTTVDNLQTLCSACNRSKGDEMPSAGSGV